MRFSIILSTTLASSALAAPTIVQRQSQSPDVFDYQISDSIRDVKDTSKVSLDKIISPSSQDKIQKRDLFEYLCILLDECF
jgi:hypothetical protein